MLGQVEIDAFVDPDHGAGEPTLQTVTDQTAASTDELFEFGFDTIVAGLDAMLGSPGGSAQRPLPGGPA